MDPYMGGGNMIREVELRSARWNDTPWKFEAGTPNVAGAIGLRAAVHYLEQVGMASIRAHEVAMVRYALERLNKIHGLETYGPQRPEDRTGVIPFNLAGVHPHDVATILDREGVAIRSGHHCAQPLHKKLGLTATNRASFYLYNLKAEVDRLVEALGRVMEVFHGG
jgi:cysteine desulfurase/selenocysteine lyase